MGTTDTLWRIGLLIGLAACAAEAPPEPATGPDDEALGLLAPADCSDVFEVALGQPVTVSWADLEVQPWTSREDGSIDPSITWLWFDGEAQDVLDRCSTSLGHDFDRAQDFANGALGEDGDTSFTLQPEDMPGEGDAVWVHVTIRLVEARAKLLPTASSSVAFVELPLAR